MTEAVDCELSGCGLADCGTYAAWMRRYKNGLSDCPVCRAGRNDYQREWARMSRGRRREGWDRW